MQDQLQRVSAGHQAAREALQTIHQGTTLLCSQIDTKSRFRLVEPKKSDARSVRKEERTELENLVVLGKGLLFPGAFSTETSNEVQKRRKQPISVSNLQDFGASKELDQELQRFLISTTQKEALEVIH